MTIDYMKGRNRWGRPQGMLWSNNSGQLIQETDVVSGQDKNYYIPLGYEVNTLNQNSEDFLILSDHNRSPINIDNRRIERRQRMANGRMRSYHIADKLNISVAWTMLPSRSYNGAIKFDPATGKPILTDSIDYDDDPFTPPQNVTPSGSLYFADQEYTADGGAGGVQMLKWYETHADPFWVYLAYDKYSNFGDDENAYNQLTGYNQILQMYITSFTYSIQKRGRNNFDMWNISVNLEEA